MTFALRILVDFIIGSHKLYFTYVRKKKNCRDQGHSKVFDFGGSPLRRTFQETPRHLSTLWPRIVSLGLLAWKPTGIALKDLSDAIRGHRQSQSWRQSRARAAAKILIFRVGTGRQDPRFLGSLGNYGQRKQKISEILMFPTIYGLPFFELTENLTGKIYR